MKHLMTAMMMVAALLVTEPPNPACLIPVPFHCDPAPPGNGPGR